MVNFLATSVNYVLLFLALYIETFFLITYLESRDSYRNKSLSTNIKAKQSKVPTVTIIVPVWNEETTVLKTIFSILKLNYPKDKLSIFIVDDGSKDNTWKVIQRFKNNKNIKLIHKENGGKHSALNHALNFVDSDLVGCLDADSFVHPEALNRIVAKFEDKEIMAVTPSIKISNPKNILQLVQKAEYILGVFIRRIFSYLNALYITPGPFTIFRRSVFATIGGYKHAHNTEDLEIALRMQKNGMKIGNVSNAFVYTTSPKSLRALYKQRLRWTYGFMKNAIDYRDMFFNLRYGNLGVIVLPAASLSLLSSLYFISSTVFDWVKSLYLNIQEIYTVGLSFNGFNFDWFYLDTSPTRFISIMAVVGTISILLISRRLAEEEKRIGIESILFLAIYVLISPLWVGKAFYNLVFAKNTSWR